MSGGYQTFTCRICGRDWGHFEDPLAHFQEEHPGHLEVISIGDVWQQTMLRTSRNQAPLRQKNPPMFGEEGLPFDDTSDEVRVEDEVSVT